MRFLILLVSCGLFLSCRPELPQEEIELPPTPILTAETRWGVVTPPYLKILADKDPSGTVRRILRRGDVVEVISSVSAGRVGRYWMEVRSSGASGWVLDDTLNVYGSEAQAGIARWLILDER